MRTSSLGRREQEVQEQRKKGRAGASTARSSVKHCKQSKRYKSNGEEREQEHEHRAEQQRKTSKSIHSCKLAKLDDRVWAFARALRARARPASRWEHLVSMLCFLHERGGMSRRIRCFFFQGSVSLDSVYRCNSIHHTTYSVQRSAYSTQRTTYSTLTRTFRVKR